MNFLRSRLFIDFLQDPSYLDRINDPPFLDTKYTQGWVDAIGSIVYFTKRKAVFENKEPLQKGGG